MTIATTNVRKHLTDIKEWQKLGEANIFPPGSRLELIDGEILEMAPIGSNHSGHLNRINKLFTILTANCANTSVQNPLRLGDLSEPEPDFMLLKPNNDFYCSCHPNADDVLLLIEVADSSLSFDQNQKLRLYASHSVPEYWLMNLNDSCVEVYRQPHGDCYGEKTTLRVGDTITLSQLNQITINITDIL
ncbi:Uma2 family endonuclease [Methylobacter sp.]|uniref:Uma2 family endonuclease n=1 Tax=Methylobacter sp. TaxID=2051955 RepID=UPI002FDEC32E